VAAATPAPPNTKAAPLVVVPPGVLYVCVVEHQGNTEQTTIDLSPQLAQLCGKNPEMGPCQYQRETCRRGGGRVFAADGREITRAIEAEYDKRVMRVRLRGD
jgi:hypothetical protein